MLSKSEVSVMKTIFDLCKKNNGTCIVANSFVLQSVPEKFNLDNVKLDVILKQLEYDGYFECTKSNKKGTTVNVINLKQKGKAFERELVQRKRDLIRLVHTRPERRIGKDHMDAVALREIGDLLRKRIAIRDPHSLYF